MELLHLLTGGAWRRFQTHEASVQNRNMEDVVWTDPNLRQRKEKSDITGAGMGGGLTAGGGAEGGRTWELTPPTTGGSTLRASSRPAER